MSAPPVSTSSEGSKLQWSKHVIEGGTPCPRGGHTATLYGSSVIIFGGHFYRDQVVGFEYLNDIHVLELLKNRWSVW